MKKHKFLNPYWKRFLRDLIVIIIVTTTFRSAVADWNDVPTGSMEPTILPGDRIFINKLAYDLKIPFTTYHIAEWGNPQKGDIVVLFSPEDSKRLVKRVIGTPGDTIAMNNNKLTINGKTLPYELSQNESANFITLWETINGTKHAINIVPFINSRNTFREIKIPNEKYFVMGDNRDNSHDSRFFGYVDRKVIIGSVNAIALSFDLEKYYLPRWSRFFKGLD